MTEDGKHARSISSVFCRSVRPAPASVTPRQPPPRPRRQRLRHEIESRRAKRVTAREPGERHPAARPQTEAGQCLVGIIRAGRQVAAMKTDQRRQRIAICFDQPARHQTRRAPRGSEQAASNSPGRRRQSRPIAYKMCNEPHECPKRHTWRYNIEPIHPSGILPIDLSVGYVTMQSTVSGFSAVRKGVARKLISRQQAQRFREKSTKRFFLKHEHAIMRF